MVTLAVPVGKMMLSVPMPQVVGGTVGLVYEGNPIELYSQEDFRSFLIATQAMIGTSLERLFCNTPAYVDFDWGGEDSSSIRLVQSDRTQWENFTHHSVRLIAGDASSLLPLAAWCVAAEIITRLSCSGDADVFDRFGEGMLPVRYIAAGAWRAGLVEISEANAYKEALADWYAQGPIARLEGVPKPVDPRFDKKVGLAQMPYLGELHQSLATTPPIEDFLLKNAICDFVVKKDGQVIVAIHDSWMQWHSPMYGVFATFDAASKDGHAAMLTGGEWGAIRVRAQRNGKDTDHDYLMMRAINANPPSLAEVLS